MDFYFFLLQEVKSPTDIQLKSDGHEALQYLHGWLVAYEIKFQW